MKKTLLILLASIIAFALVACSNGASSNENGITDGIEIVTTTAATTTAKSKFDVKFVDAEEFGSTIIYESTISRGKPARAPLDPSHEGYVFTGWDLDDYSSVMSDLTITATYRPLDKYEITFYDCDGNAIGESVTVIEGEAVEAPEAPEFFGKFFSKWDKTIEKVDRSWLDFDQYKKLSNDEIAETTLKYKVTAIYEDAGAAVPYKENITMKLREVKDENGAIAYEPVDEIFHSSKAVYYSDDIYVNSYTNPPLIDCKAKAVVAWSGDYIYVYTNVYDPTLLSRGRDYCEGEENPYKNDAIEIHYSFNAEPTKRTRSVVKIDAYGYRKFANSKDDYSTIKEQSNFFEEIEVVFAQSKDTNRYYAIFKIPAKTESGEPLNAGDAVYFSMQINDLQSLELDANGDPFEFYCIGGWRYYYGLSGYEPKWRSMVLDMEK